MSARARILERVRGATRHRAPHPGAFAARPAPATAADFARALAKAGGEARGPITEGGLAAAVRDQIDAWGGGRVVAQAPVAARLGDGPWEVTRGNEGPHGFADVAIAIAEGSVAVAENGAVALPAALAPAPALLFLCQRLILIVPADRIAADMHAAMAAAAQDAARGPTFTWIAGPSKTADIEQCLVVGAHGPRALTVLLFAAR